VPASPPERPLVLLHGFTGSPLSWRRVLAAVAPERRRFVPCLLGHDGTAGDRGATSFEQEVDRLADEVARQAFGRAHLAGYSLGARVALGLLVRHPELFAAATLFAVHPGLESDRERAERQALDRTWQELLRDEPLEVFCERWEAQPIFQSQQRLPPAVVAEQRQLRLTHHPAGLGRALAVLGLGVMPSHRAGLTSLDVPLRLVVGELDVKFSELARAMVTSLPRADLCTVPDSGHNVLLERPDVAVRLLDAT
jgi:2-succinyl-6-hydroxy-2,4-cyclohexadiene-1-carboxylate synthase